jgi:hypothetical protein
MSNRDELPIEITHKVSDASLPLLMVDAVQKRIRIHGFIILDHYGRPLSTPSAATWASGSAPAG